MSDRLLEYQAALKQYLAAQPYFSGIGIGPGGANAVPIGIVTDDVSNVEEEVNQALNTAAGICVLIRTPQGKIPHPDNPMPVYEPATIHFRIYEDATLNRTSAGTNQPSGAVAGAICQLLWWANATGALPGWNPIYPTTRVFGVEYDATTKVRTPYTDVLAEIVIAQPIGLPSRLPAITDEFSSPFVTESGESMVADS